MKINFDDKVIKETMDILNKECLVVSMEECGELIQAISKLYRNKPNLKNLTEEIADVLICIQYIMKSTDISESDIQYLVDYKLKRCEERIKNNTLKIE